MQPSTQPRLVAKPAIHRNKAVLMLYFPYNDEMITKVRSLPGVQWSNSMKCWYVIDNAKTLGALHALKNLTIIIEGKALR